MSTEANRTEADADAVASRTWRREAVRACCVEPVAVSMRGSGLAVLVALVFFSGGDWQKAFLASMSSLGLLLGPVLSHPRMAGCTTPA